jgi:hypothetical protein
MTRASRKISLVTILRYVVGIALLMTALLNGLIFDQPDWARSLGFATAGLALIVIGSGRIFRPAVSRVSDSITCRFIPWYEGNPYGALVVVPLMGIWMIVSASSHPSNGSLFRNLGIVVLAVTPVSLFYFVREWRRCLLRITGSALTLPMPAQGYALREIRRENIQSIEPAVGSHVNNLNTAMTEIVFNPMDSNPSASESVLIGPSNSKNAIWLTVEPANLLAALQAWKNGHSEDRALLDRIEAILRGGVSG